MKPDEQPIEDYNHPVAYDANGRPLYAHPASPVVVPAKTVVVEPVDTETKSKTAVNVPTKIKHDASRRLYPQLSLTKGEYVVSAVRRHPVKIFTALGIATLAVALLFTLLFNLDIFASSLSLSGKPIDTSVIILPVIMLIILICLGTYIYYYIYTNNKLYLTNERMIEEIQTGLFNRREQSIGLGEIEGVSSIQVGMMQELVDFGSIHFGMINDAATYKFNYIAHPNQYMTTLNNAIEAFRAEQK